MSVPNRILERYLGKTLLAHVKGQHLKRHDIPRARLLVTNDLIEFYLRLYALLLALHFCVWQNSTQPHCSPIFALYGEGRKILVSTCQKTGKKCSTELA